MTRDSLFLPLIKANIFSKCDEWVLLSRGVDDSWSEQSSASSSSLCTQSYHGNTTSPLDAMVFVKKPRPREPPSLTISEVFSACSVTRVLGFCRLILTIWITKFLQRSAHWSFDPQVPPLRAHGGGPGGTEESLFIYVVSSKPCRATEKASDYILSTQPSDLFFILAKC